MTMSLNNLSSALIKLRYALLSGDPAGAIERLAEVHTADSALAAEFCELRLLIDSAANRIEELLNLGEVEHACALSDAIHAIPQITAEQNADIRSFEKCFIKPFHRKWNDNFFGDYDLQAILANSHTK